MAGKTKKFSLLTPEMEVLQNTSKNDSISFDLTPEQKKVLQNTSKNDSISFDLTPEKSIADKIKLRGVELRDQKSLPRVQKQTGGDVNTQMEMLMESGETHTMPDGTEMPGATHEEYEKAMLPDEEMEDNYLDFILDEALDEEEENYLMEQLESNDKLSLIFDKVIDVAIEFAGSGPVDGPGSGVSDSIPARLSDGEFVITAKATEEIGEDNLMAMMKEAEAKADERQNVAYGGMIDEEDQAVPLPTQGSKVALGNVPNVVKQSRQVEEEMLKSSPRRYYVPVSG